MKVILQDLESPYADMILTVAIKAATSSVIAAFKGQEKA